MPSFLSRITQQVSSRCGLERIPNAVNANLYRNGRDTVGWHADDELLFDSVERDSLVMSLSLGQQRTFQLRPKEFPHEVTNVLLGNGDLCMMEGFAQKHYLGRSRDQCVAPGAHGPPLQPSGPLCVR